MDDKIWHAKLLQSDDEAWSEVSEKVVGSIAKNKKYYELMNRYCITSSDLMSMLFEEMIMRSKLSLYRGEGSLAGFLKQYVKGFIYAANPSKHGEVSIDTPVDSESERSSSMEIPFNDISNSRKEAWHITHICFRKLWNLDPERAYIHLLKTRFHFSSEEIKNFLNISSISNVDKIFSRNIQFMRKSWPKH
jgi:hypothetical protein